jgi:hypothetical protein
MVLETVEENKGFTQVQNQKLPVLLGVPDKIEPRQTMPPIRKVLCTDLSARSKPVVGFREGRLKELVGEGGWGGLKKLYDIPSSVVHGTPLDDKQRKWLIQNCAQIEHRVRQVLVAGVQNAPAEEAERRTLLAGLYDPADEDRAEFALQKFQEIRTDLIRKALAEKSAKS